MPECGWWVPCGGVIHAPGLFLTTSYQVEIINPILQMRKLKLRQ